MIPIYFIKAVQKKTITVPGYARRNGTYVPPHQKTVMFDPDKDVHAVVSGDGTHAQKIAHKKLHAKHGNFKHIPEHEQHAHILALATDIQSAASQSAEVSKWSKAALAGKSPTKANWAAFNALPPEKQAALTEKVKQAVGVDHLVNPQAASEPASATKPARSAKADPPEAWKPTVKDVEALMTMSKPEQKEVLNDWSKKIGSPKALVDALNEVQAQMVAPKPATPKPKAAPVKPDSVKTAPAKKAEDPKAGDVLPSPEAVGSLPFGTVLELSYQGKKTKALVVGGAVFLSQKNGIGYYKKPLSMSQLHGFKSSTSYAHMFSVYSDEPYKVLEVGHAGYMTEAQSATVGSLLKAKEGKYAAVGTYRFENGSAHVLVGEIGKPSSFAWVDATGEWAAGFLQSDVEKLKTGRGMKPVDLGGSGPAEAQKPDEKEPAAQKDPNHDAAQAKLDELLSGTGAHYAVKAAKKLAQDDAWGKAEPVEKLKQVLSLGKEMQAAATASADVTKYKKSVASGKVPAKAQIKAFLALPEDKQTKVLEGLLAAHGFKHVSDLHNEAIKKHGVTQQSVLDELAAKKPDDEDWETALFGSKTEPQKAEPPAGEWSPGTFAHTKTGATVHVVKIPKKLPDDEYKTAAAKAKANGGHYSSYKKDGAIPGFHFKTEDQAKAFADAMNGEDGPKDGDTKQGADGTLVFKDGRWHKQGATVQAADQGVEGWKQSILAGKVPTAEQHEAFSALSTSDQWAAQDEVESNIGFTALDAILKKLEDRQIGGKKGQQEPKDMPQDLAGWRQAMMSGQVPTPRQTKAYLSGNIDETDKALNDVTAKIGYPAVKKLMGGETPDLPDAPDSAETWDFDPSTQKGSNAGGLYTDTMGQKWYVKIPKSEDHAKNELLAAKLYEAAGVAVPELKLVQSNGKAAIASKWVDGMSKVGADIKHADGALEGFAVDAWLANYDSVGTGYDNLLKDADGKAVRIDVGGALLYRAQGLPKTNFNASVVELQGMLDPNVNHYASQVFGGITPAQLKAGSTKVAAVSPETIKDLVDQYGPGSADEKAALADLIIARRETVLAAHPPVKAKAKKAPKTKKAQAAPEPEAPVYRIPEAPDFENWNGPGHGLSGKASFNKQNQEIADEIYKLGAAGDVDALQNMQFQPIDETGAPSGDEKPVAEHPSKHIPAYHKDVLKAMVTPYVSIKKLVAAQLSAVPDSFKRLGKALKGVKNLKEAAVQVGRYAVIGKTDAAHILGQWNKPPATSKKQGTLDEYALFKASKASFATLSNVQKQAIKDYTGGSYSDMNSALIQGIAHDKAHNAIKGLEKASIPLPAGTVISRYASFDKNADGDYVSNGHDKAIKTLMAAGEGALLQEFGIISTSTNSTTWSGKVHLKITVGEGVKGLYVAHDPSGGGESPISKNPSEREIILPYGTQFMVTKIHKQAGNYADETGDWGSNSGGHVIELLVMPNSDIDMTLK